MTYVVTEKCIDCKYTTCVDNCPVEAFKQHDRMVIIDPNICIDCGMCIDDCPIDAIITDNTEHPKLDELIQYAEDASKTWPIIRVVGTNIQNPDLLSQDKWENKPQLSTRDEKQ